MLALSIQSAESIQAFFFYIIQYSLSNLNAFLIIIVIGYFFFNYVLKKQTVSSKINFENNNLEYNEKENTIELKDINNSPIQLISQIKGISDLNPILAISLSITLFSLIGVPPLIGFFGKQMILSAALDKGYIFMSLIAIITSVISAVYYLIIIKNIFFESHNLKLNSKLKNINIMIIIENKIHKLLVNNNNILISSSLTSVISIITMIILLFMFVSKE